MSVVFADWFRLEYRRSQAHTLAAFYLVFLLFVSLAIFCVRDDSPHSNNLVLTGRSKVLAILGEYHCPDSFVLGRLVWLFISVTLTGLTIEFLGQEYAFERLLSFVMRSDFDVLRRRRKSRDEADRMRKHVIPTIGTFCLRSRSIGVVRFDDGLGFLCTYNATEERYTFSASRHTTLVPTFQIFQTDGK
jgi:hypothetical protein